MLPTTQTQSTYYKLNIFYFQLFVKTKNKRNNLTLHKFKDLNTSSLFTIANQHSFDFTFIKFLQKTLPLFTQIIESNQYSTLKAFMFYTSVKLSRQKKIVRRRRCFFFKIKSNTLRNEARLQADPKEAFNFWLLTFKKLKKTKNKTSLGISKSRPQQLKLKKYLYLISKFATQRRAKSNIKTVRSLYASKLFFYRKSGKSRQLRYKHIRNRIVSLSWWNVGRAGRKRFKKSLAKLLEGDFLKIELSSPGKRSAHEDLRIVKNAKQRRKQSINLKWARRLRKQYRRRMRLRIILKRTAKRLRRFYIKKHKLALTRPAYSNKRAAALKNFQGWVAGGNSEPQVAGKKRSLFAMMHEERERLKKENPGNSSITYMSPARFNPNEFAANKRVHPFNYYLNKNLKKINSKLPLNKRYTISSVYTRYAADSEHQPERQQHLKKEFSFFTKIDKKEWTVPVRYWLINNSTKYYRRVRQTTRKSAMLKKQLIMGFLNTHANTHKNLYKLLQTFFKTYTIKPNYKQIINNFLVYLTQRRTVNFIFLKKRKHLYQLFFYWLTSITNLFKFRIKNLRQLRANSKLKRMKAHKKSLYTHLKKKTTATLTASLKLKKRIRAFTRMGEVVKGGVILEAGKETAPNNQTPMRLNHAFLLFFNRVSRYYKNALYGFKIKLKKTQRRNLKILHKLKKKFKQNKRFVRYSKQRKALSRLNKTHKDRRTFRDVFTVLPFKVRKSLYTKTLPILRKKKPNKSKKFLIFKRNKISKNKNLKSGYSRRKLYRSTIDGRDTFIRLLKGKSCFKRARYKSIPKRRAKQPVTFKAYEYRLLSAILGSANRNNNLTIQTPKKLKITKIATLRKLKLLRYLKKLLKKVRRKHNIFRSRLKALYFKRMRRPTYRRLARRPWKIQWKRITRSLKKKNFKLKKHLLRSMNKAVKRSHFFVASEKHLYRPTKALKYRYLLTKSDTSGGSDSIKVFTLKPQSVLDGINLSTSNMHTYNRMQGLLSPRLFNVAKRLAYTALKNVFPFPHANIKRHKIKRNYNITLTRRQPTVHPSSKAPTFDLGFKLKQQALPRGKRAGRVLFALTLKPSKRLKTRRKLKQLNFRNLKFKFLNFFVLNFFSHKNINYTFNRFIKYRVASRAWPKQNSLNRNERKRSMRLKTRINFIKILKNKYLHNPIQNTKNKLTFADVIENKTTYKFFDKKKTSKLALIDKQYSQEKAVSNRNNLHDLTKHFLKTLWAVQYSFRKTIRKGISLNRWRFKKKFWEWFRGTKGIRSYKPNASVNFPNLQSLLIKLGIINTKLAFANLLRMGLVKHNNMSFKLQNLNPAIGDYVTLPAFTTYITKTENLSIRYAKQKLKRSQRKHRLIVTSQWRQKKKTRPSIHKLFQRFKYISVPSWLEFDMFISCFAFIKYPQNLMYRKDDIKTNPMLLKLTPWRLKV